MNIELSKRALDAQMNYSQVERDNIARGNRMAIDILFVLIKILDVRFNSVISIIRIQQQLIFPFYLRDLEERDPNLQTFDTTRSELISPTALQTS